MTRDAAVIARAAEIIEREANRWLSEFSHPGGGASDWVRAEHADMLAVAKALRVMLEDRA